MHIGVLAARLAMFVAGFVLLSACSGGDSRPTTVTSAAVSVVQQSDAPVPTGEVATDGLTWINYRRAQAGLQPLTRDPRLDRAAAAHAGYQQLNNLINHQEDPLLAGFTGPTSTERVRAAGYPLELQAQADGEVIAATAEPDGFAAAEGLLGAIYHRYLMLEPRFDVAGAGDAHRGGGYYWLNVNLVASRNGTGLGPGRMVVWPLPDQRGVTPRFFSDQETPDPVAGRNTVGYPVSVHASLGSQLRVGRFVIRERGGRELRVVQLDASSDRETPLSAAAIIPLARLRSGVQHDVEFSGTVDGIAIEKRWSFMTR
jgi:uncharacterized protein YkwD